MPSSSNPSETKDSLHKQFLQFDNFPIGESLTISNLISNLENSIRILFFI